MISWRYFEIAAPKIKWENTQENICSSHLMKLHDYSLQPTAALKPLLQMLFWKCSEGKGCSKISKTPKNLCKTVSSSLTLQACVLEFSASTKQAPRKKFYNGVLKRSIMESFYQGNKITI